MYNVVLIDTLLTDPLMEIVFNTVFQVGRHDVDVLHIADQEMGFRVLKILLRYPFPIYLVDREGNSAKV